MDYWWLLAAQAGGMVAISLYGFARIPSNGRFRLRFGGTGHESTIGKTAGLILWPGLGAALAFVGTRPLVGEESWWWGLSSAGISILTMAQWTSIARLRD